MRAAITQAHKSRPEAEIPIGSTLVLDKKISRSRAQ